MISHDVAVSVVGRARVSRSELEHDVDFAPVDINVLEGKNDMVYRIAVDSGIEIHAKERFKPWYDAVMAELDATR